jgi:hypothetical protein
MRCFQLVSWIKDTRKGLMYNQMAVRTNDVIIMYNLGFKRIDMYRLNGDKSNQKIGRPAGQGSRGISVSAEHQHE